MGLAMGAQQCNCADDMAAESIDRMPLLDEIDSAEYTADEAARLNSALQLYMMGIREGKPREALEICVGARYTQHNTDVKDGKDGFLEFFEGFLKKNPTRHMDVIRSFVDGNYVFCQVTQSLNNGESKWVTMDMFDTDENNKIVEHWDVLEEWKYDWQCDGPTEETDLHLTKQNKSRVRLFLVECFQNMKADAVIKYVDATSYTEHSAHGKRNENAVDAIVDCISKREKVYEFVRLVMARGNFAFALSKVIIANDEWCVTELFRLENSMIVEHWELRELVPPVEKRVNSGKF